MINIATVKEINKLVTVRERCIAALETAELVIDMQSIADRNNDKLLTDDFSNAHPCVLSSHSDRSGPNAYLDRCYVENVVSHVIRDNLIARIAEIEQLLREYKVEL